MMEGMSQAKMPPPPPMPVGRMTKNDLYNYAYTMRASWLQAMIDPRRDIEKECGYPYVILPKQYRYMYDREGVATRVNNIYPDECWAVDPVVYEEEATHIKTDFEVAWTEMQMTEENNPLHYMHRIDCLSGIGRYGTLLLGINDGLDLSEPIPGMNPDGTMDPKAQRRNKYKLLYMRPFDELMSTIINFERDPTNPRFGKPEFYHMIFADIRVGDPGMTATATSVTSRIVHWSRVVHVADNRETSEVFGVPRQQPVFNRLCDVRKILGGNGEMFWKGGFPGYSFELNPNLVTAGVQLDTASMEKQFQDYSNGLTRYLSLVGLQAKSLAPQVADPTNSLQSQLQAIALTIGVPMRIFIGSEQAQLASGQDVRTWNRRLARRQNRYLTPMLLRPFVQRLIILGILPQPKKPVKVFWPDIQMPDENDRAQMADKISTALMKYVQGGGNQIIPPREYLTVVLGLSEEVADMVYKAALKNSKTPQFKVEPPNTAGGQGQDGNNQQGGQNAS